MYKPIIIIVPVTTLKVSKTGYTEAKTNTSNSKRKINRL